MTQIRNVTQIVSCLSKLSLALFQWALVKGRYYWKSLPTFVQLTFYSNAMNILTIVSLSLPFDTALQMYNDLLTGFYSPRLISTESWKLNENFSVFNLFSVINIYLLTIYSRLFIGIARLVLEFSIMSITIKLSIRHLLK